MRTGKVLLSLRAAPAVPDGQNFSLSPEGARLAVVNGTTLEGYELPEMLTGDRARFIAVKAEVPASVMFLWHKRATRANRCLSHRQLLTPPKRTLRRKAQRPLQACPNQLPRSQP